MPVLAACAVVACGAPRLPPPEPMLHAAPTTTTIAPTPARPPPALPARDFAYDDLLVDGSHCAEPSRPRISRDDALADISVLERILRRGYAGFDPLAQRGVDWEAIFVALRAGAREMSVEAFQNQLLAQLAPARDNHLAVIRIDKAWDWRSAGGHEDAYVVEGGDAGCGAMRPFVVKPPRVVWKPVVFNQPHGVTCGGKLRPTHRVRVAQPQTRTPVFEQIAGPTPHLRLRSLSGHHLDALDAFVATADHVRTAPVAIVDLRGNGGGSDGPVTEWFEALTSHPIAYPAMKTLSSDVTLQGDVNLYTCRVATGGGSDERGRAALAERLASAHQALALNARAALDLREVFSRQPTLRPADVPPFAGRLVILVDAGCASACETFVVYARQIEGTLIVGENSGGVGEFGELKRYRLPRSGLWLDAGSKWFTSQAGAQVARETVGHMPDIWIDDAASHTIAVAIATCLSKPGCAATLKANLAAPPR